MDFRTLITKHHSISEEGLKQITLAEEQEQPLKWLDNPHEMPLGAVSLLAHHLRMRAIDLFDFYSCGINTIKPETVERMRRKAAAKV